MRHTHTHAPRPARCGTPPTAHAPPAEMWPRSLISFTSRAEPLPTKGKKQPPRFPPWYSPAWIVVLGSFLPDGFGWPPSRRFCSWPTSTHVRIHAVVPLLLLWMLAVSSRWCVAWRVRIVAGMAQVLVSGYLYCLYLSIVNRTRKGLHVHIAAVFGFTHKRWAGAKFGSRETLRIPVQTNGAAANPTNTSGMKFQAPSRFISSM